MPKSYLHSNGRLTMRSSGGQFRQSILSDIGMAVATCPVCNTGHFHEGYSYEVIGAFVHQVKNKPTMICDCGYNFATGQMSQQGLADFIGEG